MNKFDRCPCRSKSLYHKCCQPYHQGSAPETALALMRSRYSAYALALVNYIVETTHSAHPEYSTDRDKWKKQIRAFCTQTRFDGVKILAFVDGQDEASVTFTAYLRQADTDASFTEKSLFLKENGRWLYKSGEVSDPDGLKLSAADIQL
jgi:SEC-C motif domain protein